MESVKSQKYAQNTKKERKAKADKKKAERDLNAWSLDASQVSKPLHRSGVRWRSIVGWSGVRTMVKVRSTVDDVTLFPAPTLLSDTHWKTAEMGRYHPLANQGDLGDENQVHHDVDGSKPNRLIQKLSLRRHREVIHEQNLVLCTRWPERRPFSKAALPLIFEWLLPSYKSMLVQFVNWMGRMK